jgi:hypothetical protein
VRGNTRPSRFFRRAGVKTNLPGAEVYLSPLQRQDLARDAPAGDVRELNGRLERRRQIATHGGELVQPPRRSLTGQTVAAVTPWMFAIICANRLLFRARLRGKHEQCI